MQTDMFTLRCSYTQMNTHSTSTTYVPSCMSLFSCILPFGRRLHSFFYRLLYHQRTRFHFFFFQSKIEILQAYLHVRPHTHVHTKETHIHRDTQIHTPRGHAFFYFPVSNKKKQKKRLKREMKGVLKGGNWKRRDMHSCVFERQSSLSKREKGGPIKEVTRLSLSFYAFMEW